MADPKQKPRMRRLKDGWACIPPEFGHIGVGSTIQEAWFNYRYYSPEWRGIYPNA
jgi:hypothetical protein